jgi:hypothetical protein
MTLVANDVEAARQDRRCGRERTLDVIASNAKQSRATQEAWIASSQELLAMTWICRATITRLTRDPV